MTEIALRYAKTSLSLQLAAEPVVIAPPSSGPALSGDDLTDALARAKLAETLGGARKIALVVNDQTRKAGVRALLDAIVPMLPSGAEVAIVIAYGLHARQSDDVSHALYGPAAMSRARLVHHDAQDPSTLLDVGALPEGHHLSLCRDVVDADVRVLVGGLGFHYHAGFSGGRKAIFPGVADRASIERNHLRVLDPNGPNGRAAGCGPSQIDGNPVSEEMMWGPRLLERAGGRVFLANAIVDASGAIVDVAVGLDHERAFREGSSRLLSRMSVPLGSLPDFDGVIASAGGAPYDGGLYQAHKAYDNAYRAVLPKVMRGDRPTVIFVAACNEGLGHPRFAHWLEQPTAKAHYEALRTAYEIVGQTSLAVRDKAAQTRTIAVTDLSPDACAKLGWERAASIEDALARAGAQRLAVMPSAAQTLPRS